MAYSIHTECKWKTYYELLIGDKVFISYIGSISNGGLLYYMRRVIFNIFTILSMLILISITAHADVWVNHHSDNFDKVTPVDYWGTVDIANDLTSPDSTPNVWRFTYLKNTVVGSV